MCIGLLIDITSIIASQLYIFLAIMPTYCRYKPPIHMIQIQRNAYVSQYSFMKVCKQPIHIQHYEPALVINDLC